MLFQLDPTLPAVWRTPTSLQFGVSRPTVVLDDVGTAEEKIIAALATGISRSALGMIGRVSGATDLEIDALLDRLGPALLTPKPRAVRTVVIAGVGLFAERLTEALATSGVQVLVAKTVEAAEAATAEFAVAVGHFVLDPALHGLWLRRDVPHLPVILGDTTVTIGPLVVPGSTACLYCLQRHASEGDAAWPAIASQLWGRRSPADTELVASEAAAIVARQVLAWVGGRGGVASTQLEVDVTTGAQSHRHFAIHPECGCVAPARTNAATLRENG